MWASRGSKLHSERKITPALPLSLFSFECEVGWRVPQVRDPGTRLTQAKPQGSVCLLRRREYNLPV